MPSTRFLFWNINRKPLADVVHGLAIEHRIDVVVLAESSIDLSPFILAPGERKAVQIFTRFPEAEIQPAFDSARISILRLLLPARSEAILAAVHLPSKLFWSESSQGFECGELGRKITEVEAKAGHQRTVLVGDFNMNPFEVGMVAASGLHGVMVRSIADRGARTVQGRQYPYFYNPMWSHLGDARQPPGSYYYDSSEHVNYFWNTFDQVLIRPTLMNGFDANRLVILTKDGEQSLVRADGTPNKEDFSDHLPIVFELEF